MTFQSAFQPGAFQPNAFQIWSVVARRAVAPVLYTVRAVAPALASAARGAAAILYRVRSSPPTLED